MALTIESLNDGNCKTYLVSDGKVAAICDPVHERVEDYKSVLAERGLELALLIETHTHADHLMVRRADKEALGVEIAMHRLSPGPLVDRHFDDGVELSLGDDIIHVLHTPGHTPDSVSFEVPSARAVLTGDTLLIGGSGRTDFPGGDAGQQYDAVMSKLFTLPDDYTVWPGHDYKGNTSSTIGEEKTNNARFTGRSRDEYIEFMANLGLPFPDRIQEVLQVNQSGFEASEVSFPSVHDIAVVPTTTPKRLAAALATEDPPLVLDVREPEEFVGVLGHIEGALLVPLDLLEKRLPKLAGYVDRRFVVVCRAGARSASACARLRAAGFPAVENLAGGMVAWSDLELPIQR